MSQSLTPCAYKTGRKLGEGSYSIVREATHTTTSQKYAVKIISKALMRGKEHMVINEIAVLKKVSRGHAGIMTLVDYFESPNNLYLVMDLCEGGELFERIYKRGPVEGFGVIVGFYFEEDGAKTVKLVLSALAYIHSQIKPENLLYKSDSESDLLLADFGLSRLVDDDSEQLKTRCGTCAYMAPEILRRTGYGKPVDMWSIGVLTYFLLCGYTPFDGSSPTDELQNIVKANYHFEPAESWQHVSLLAKAFIRSCLQLDSCKRPTAASALSDPWILTHSPNESPEDPGEKESEECVLRRALSQRSVDLLPLIKKKFDARRAFKRAIGVVRAVGKFSQITQGLSGSTSQTLSGCVSGDLSVSTSSISEMDKGGDSGESLGLQDLSVDDSKT